MVDPRPKQARRTQDPNYAIPNPLLEQSAKVIHS
jgi:hypothetical protein